MRNYILLGFIVLAGFTVIWSIQEKDKVAYRGLVAVKLGHDYTIFEDHINRKEALMLPKEHRYFLQKELRSLNIELVGSNLDVIIGLKDPAKGKKELAYIKKLINLRLKMYNIKDYYSYGSDWATLEEYGKKICKDKVSSEDASKMEQILSSIISYESKLASGKNDQGNLAFQKALKGYGDIKPECDKFISKTPTQTMSALIFDKKKEGGLKTN